MEENKNLTVEQETIKTPVKKEKEFPKFIENLPEHKRNLFLIIINNAEIRRFLSITILDYLGSKGLIEKNANHKYVTFKKDKFTVCIDGCNTDYRYSITWFTTCYSAAFTRFASNAQRILNEYLKVEKNTTFNDTVDAKEVNNLINKNE